MSRIISTGIAVPRYKAYQSDILDFMCRAYDHQTASRKLRILFHSSGIETRHSVVPDFANHTTNGLFFNNGKPDVEKRMNLYRENAADLAIEAIENLFSKMDTDIHSMGITHLIAVTCTGMYAPGIETEIMEKLKLPCNIFRTAVNFQGCNAAFPAQRIADAFARSGKNVRVLVVSVELCTIHFQPKYDNDNLLSNTIFGDGAAAMLMVHDDYAARNGLRGLRIDDFYSAILNEGKELMAWDVKSVNFEMVLNPRVPDFIGERINDFIAETVKNLRITPSEVSKWAIHPGGRKILDNVKKQLGLQSEDMAVSYSILSKYGNMSSATIVFILNRIMEQDNKRGEKVLAVGFGPGISVDTILYSYEE